jgi:hypothetical protein
MSTKALGTAMKKDTSGIGVMISAMIALYVLL